MNAVLGYGSLINPLSLTGRVVGNDVDKRYEENITLTEPYDLTPSINKFKELYNTGVNIFPVKLSGYKRHYSIQHRGGGMLEVYRSDSNWINGMLYTNLPDEIYQSVIETEADYIVDTIDFESFIYYKDTSLTTGETTIFIPQKEQPRTDVKKHPVYHDGILRGFIYLYGSSYISNKILDEFVLDFLETTYEYHEEEWKTLKDINGSSDLDRIKNMLNTDSYFTSM